MFTAQCILSSEQESLIKSLDQTVRKIAGYCCVTVIPVLLLAAANQPCAIMYAACWCSSYGCGICEPIISPERKDALLDQYCCAIVPTGIKQCL